MLDWLGSALAGKGARPVETHRALRRAHGPGRRPERSADPSARHQPALRRDGQRRGVARRRAGRRAQRLGVPSGGGRVPAGARGRAGARPQRRASCSRPRSPATRSASASASSSAARTTSVFHTTGTAGTLAAAAAVGRLLGLDAGADARTPSARPGTQAAGLWEFLRDAADSKQLHTAHAAAGRPDCGLSRRRRLHRRAAHPRRRAGHGGGHVERRRSGAPRRPASARAGRWPRPRSSSTPPAATPIRRPTRCCRSMRAQRPARRRHRRASPRTSTRARSTCSARSSIRRPCTRRSSRWARCSA